MKILWEMSASTAFDQMPLHSRKAVTVAMHRLAQNNPVGRPELKAVQGLPPFRGQPVKSLRVSNDLRALVAVTSDTVHVIDLVRREQLHRLGG